ncbi:hypothetical protein AALO_G00129430 [Alosa alosa]|uniref:Uncharacterized protein n=1 Tax=Alosa alosa TaxID=278164 RepID=A0AAV6GM78_9TELE|nr:hypothetical protein AALO_G00129430 [Alosa alosa]
MMSIRLWLCRDIIATWCLKETRAGQPPKMQRGKAYLSHKPMRFDNIKTNSTRRSVSFSIELESKPYTFLINLTAASDYNWPWIIHIQVKHQLSHW